MKISKLKRILAFALCLVLLAALAPTRAYAVTQEEINALRAQRDAITAQREEAQAVVDALEAEQAGVIERKKAMDERNAYTLQQIQLTQDEIDLYDEMIADKAKEVDAAKALEDEQLARYRVRVRAMEESGGYNVLAMVLRASSLGELLTVMDDVGEIMERDREIEDAYIAAREHTEEVKAEYEEFKAELEAKQEELRAQQVELQAEIDEATELIRQLEEDIEANKEQVHEILLAEIEADNALAEMVAEMERQRQAELERQRQEQAAAGGGGGGGGGGSVSGSGSFGWPVPSSTYITSRFGLRIHPIYNTEKNHTGIDIAANEGSSILAADGGTVTLASWYGGYGNCVMIDHGNGYVTLYGHMSSIAVSQGQSVSKGDTIGYVGSTGVATGPHCHFEIYSGGSRIDPEQFFSGLTFSPDAGV